jgi:hypothetical protein
MAKTGKTFRVFVSSTISDEARLPYETSATYQEIHIYITHGNWGALRRAWHKK